MNKTDFRIGHEQDALDLLDEMILQCEAMNAWQPEEHQGMKNALGNEGYFWPRLAALKKALATELI